MKARKTFLTVAATMFCILIFGLTAMAGDWQWGDYGWWYEFDDGSYATNGESDSFLDGVNCVLDKFEHWATVAGGFIGLPVNANSDSLDLFPGWLIKDDIIKTKIPYFRTKNC